MSVAKTRSLPLPARSERWGNLVDRGEDAPPFEPIELAEVTLEDLVASLEELPDEPRARELRVRARALEHVVGRWQSIPPTPAQRLAVAERVRDLERAFLYELPEAPE